MTRKRKVAKRERAVALVTRKALLIDLPVEVLSLIFASLPPASLCSIRAVCRAFRTASLPHIQISRISTTCLSTARRQLKLLPPSAGTGAELHSVDATALACVRMLTPQMCRLRICAACHAHGCETHAVIQPEKFGASLEFAIFMAQLAQATRLTSLRLDHCEALAAPLVAACPQLQDLVVSGRTRQKAFPLHSQLLQALQQASGLQSLEFVKLSHWRRLLPALAGLPKLISLGKVSVFDEATMTRVAALTQLTSLELFWRDNTNGVPTRASAAHLSCLTRLRVLRMHTGPLRTEQLGQAFQGLLNLQDLSLRVVKMEPTRCIAPLTSGAVDRTSLISAILRPLTNLTGLELSCVLSPSDACVVARVLPTSLRSLLLILGRDDAPVHAQPAHGGHSVLPEDQSRAAAADLAPIMSRLRMLELALLTQEAWAAFTPSLKACTGLKSLLLRGPGAAVKESLPLGPLLSRMKGLKALVLMSALDVSMAATDISCIAQLTALQNLRILSWRVSSEVSGQRPDTAVAELVRNIDLLPLAGLWMLKQCHIHSMRSMRGGGTRGSAFKKRLHDLQWAVGLPLAKVADVAFDGTLPKMWCLRPCDGYDV